jgi:hypothetical protein
MRTLLLYGCNCAICTLLLHSDEEFEYKQCREAVNKIRQDKLRFAKRYGKQMRSSSISDKQPTIRELMEVWLEHAGYKVTRQFGHAELVKKGVSALCFVHAYMSAVKTVHVPTLINSDSFVCPYTASSWFSVH